jgi:hypothetical protein
MTDLPVTVAATCGDVQFEVTKPLVAIATASVAGVAAALECI